MLKSYIPLLLCFFFSISCSLVQKITVGTTAGLLYDAGYELETEGNWEKFQMAVPANLKVVEGLYFLEPNNTKLLVSLIKGYAAYSFAVHETLYIKDQINDNTENSIHKLRGIQDYSRAFRYGLKFLADNDISFDDLKKNINVKNGIYKLLEDELDDGTEELEGVLFTAQALGGLINFQRDDMQLVAQLPIVKGMFDWVCEKRPDINFGACQIFAGAYEAGRPKMLGGNPQKGKEIFLKLIEKYPHNWLARVAYMQFYLLPMSEEDGYKEQKFHMEKFSRAHHQQLKWAPNQASLLGAQIKAFEQRRLRVFQAIAIKRFEIIKSLEKELF